MKSIYFSGLAPLEATTLLLEGEPQPPFCTPRLYSLSSPLPRESRPRDSEPHSHVSGILLLSPLGHIAGVSSSFSLVLSVLLHLCVCASRGDAALEA